MDGATNSATFEGEIEAFVRSECIGFQRGPDGLIPVVQSLVQPKRGPLTTVYEIQARDGLGRKLLRYRPRIDIIAPQRRPVWNDE
jgi:hypothetical protein